MPQRAAIARIERAPSAPVMLDLHAAHLRRINERSAGIAWVVEQAAADDPVVESLWSGMNHNRAFAVDWATDVAARQAGTQKRPAAARRRNRRSGSRSTGAPTAPSPHHAGLAAADYEAWLRRYYRLVFLPR